MKPLVMFVDDDPMVLAAMRRQLIHKLGECDLTFCLGGRVALDKASVRPPTVVFSDMRMPEMDGPAFLESIKQRYPATICYALTGQSDEEALARVVGLVEQVLVKPIDTEKLVHIIARHLGTANS